ncbi:unnamed protein product [Adineta steineri]|uniref:NAD(P)(+)--arginine ADP-ribosyltransferase n=1 Tax=Adineta steineri TaxID=433720 RepID=A0A818KI63_9BILA|nr:unnamed protein product [Adineta steineri]
MDSKPLKPSVKSFHEAAASYVRQPRQRMPSNYLLVWIDTSIDQTNKDCKNTLAHLKNVINDVKLCTQPDQCVQVLKQYAHERAFVITSSALGQHLIPEIHGMPQLDAIYIFCGNKFRYQEWTQNWTKIKGVYTNVKDICQALQVALKQCEQDTIASTFLTINEIASPENSNQLESVFMYTQLFKEILLEIEYDRKAIKNLAACCRKVFSGNTVELQLINEFEHDYRPQKAIWWYTRECFTYKMLNQALRTLDADIIINMGFFLRDLHQQIQQLYEQQVTGYGGKSFVVYRGQGLIQSDFEKLQKTKGGLVSSNTFLPISRDEKVSLEFARRASTRLDMVGILFVMFIDPCIRSVPYASIKEMSSFKKDDEILFSMHTVFRVGEIKQMDDKNKLYQVELQLTSDDDEQLRLLTNRIQEEASGSTGWQRLGSLLLYIGQFNKAEELYNVLLEQTTDTSERTLYYNQLGSIHLNQGDYEKTVWFYEKALEIQQKTVSSNHPSLATLYNNIGMVYNKIGEYRKALSFYGKALEIDQKTLHSNHPYLATSYNNIGNVYNKREEYSKAFSFYGKALEIREKCLLSNHPDLASSYNNIGSVCDSMGEYSKALSSHEKALKIYRKTLPSNHPDLTISYSNIGSVYHKMGEYSHALSFYENAHKIWQKTLPLNHPHLAASYNNIGQVYKRMGEYSKALSSHEKALKIYLKALRSNHPDLASSFNNIGSVYDNMGEYSKAFSFYEKALEIRQTNLPSNHPSFATSYNNIAGVCYIMQDYSKALSYFERALDIFQRALPPTHANIITVKESIDIVKKNL